jgi:signal transduction histidine kinase
LNAGLIPYRDFFENYAEAILIANDEHLPLFINSAFTRLTGFTNQQVHLIKPEQLADTGAEIPGNYDGGILLNSSGNPVHLKVSRTAITLTDGSAGLLYTCFDLKDLKTAKDEINRLTVELKKVTEEFDQFGYVTSHDLQEPLRMIGGYVQLMQKSLLKGDVKLATEFMVFVLDGVTRLQSLINDLLQFSRVNRRGSAFVKVNLNDAIKITLSHLSEKIKTSGAVIGIGELPVVTGDTFQLVRLFQNLLDNAIKFVPPGKIPEIEISAREENGKYLFRVSDNGIGIDIKFHNRIFAIFQRLHTRSEYPGTGIGLAVCKKIVERHGGEIWLESEPGKGSSFIFTIKK